MKRPQIDLLPLRSAVCTNAGTILDVLVKVTPPVPERPVGRPPLNLGLVLDRSGSMAGRNKMDYARQAAAFAVQQLLPTDRVSVTIFGEGGNDRAECLRRGQGALSWTSFGGLSPSARRPCTAAGRKAAGRSSSTSSLGASTGYS